MQKKSLYLSNNRAGAKQEVSNILQSIQSGIIPTEIKMIMNERQKSGRKTSLSTWKRQENKENTANKSNQKLLSSHKKEIKKSTFKPSKEVEHSKPLQKQMDIQDDEDNFTLKPIKFVSAASICITKAAKKSVYDTPPDK